MALINCSECGNEISDQASSCPKCGAPVKKSVQMVYCKRCGNPIPSDARHCSECGFDQVAGTLSSNNSKKKDSPVCIVGCALILVSMFIFAWLSVGGVICGIIDVATNDKRYRHFGGWVCIILGTIIAGVWVSRIYHIF